MMLHTLNLKVAVCQLYLTKTRGENTTALFGLATTYEWPNLSGPRLLNLEQAELQDH